MLVDRDCPLTVDADATGLDKSGNAAVVTTKLIASFPSEASCRADDDPMMRSCPSIAAAFDDDSPSVAVLFLCFCVSILVAVVDCLTEGIRSSNTSDGMLRV